MPAVEFDLSPSTFRIDTVKRNQVHYDVGANILNCDFNNEPQQQGLSEFTHFN